MAIKLRQDESVHCVANFHWSSYLWPGLWALLIGLPSLAGTVIEGSNIVMPAIGFAPILYVWLRNKTKSYVVTNQRLYVEEGILSKSKIDIPFNKINDITFNQGIIQRLLGSGSVAVMTGNDKPTKLTNLDKPEDFREALVTISHKKN